MQYFRGTLTRARLPTSRLKSVGLFLVVLLSPWHRRRLLTFPLSLCTDVLCTKPLLLPGAQENVRVQTWYDSQQGNQQGNRPIRHSARVDENDEHHSNRNLTIYRLPAAQIICNINTPCEYTHAGMLCRSRWRKTSGPVGTNLK